MYNVSETVLPIYINGQCPIIKTCSDVTLNLSSKDSTFDFSQPRFRLSHILCTIAPLENHSLEFLTRSATNRAVPPQKMARVLKFLIEEVEELYYHSCANKGVDQLCHYCAVGMRLCLRIYAISRFSHTAAQTLNYLNQLEYGINNICGQPCL